MLVSRGLGTVLRDLAALGFDAAWTVLSAADVGAPHLRERIWIVAHSGENGRLRRGLVSDLDRAQGAWRDKASGAKIGTGLKYFRGTEKHLRGGYPSPTLTEWLMGWPTRWSDLQPLGTDRYQEWQQQHLPCWQSNC
jgi:site-specific DNA-cytosine methylase